MTKAKITIPNVPLPERLEHEPAKWFSRFIKFVLQPPGKRSVEQIFRDEHKAVKGGAKGSARQRRPGGAWRRAYTAYQWEKRTTEFDAEMAAAEFAEMEETRRNERYRCRELARQFMARAEEFVKETAFLRANPAGASILVARAAELSMKTWGLDIQPENQKVANGNFSRRSDDVEVRIFMDDGSGNPIPFSEWPPPDKLDPNFHPEEDPPESPS